MRTGDNALFARDLRYLLDQQTPKRLPSRRHAHWGVVGLIALAVGGWMLAGSNAVFDLEGIPVNRASLMQSTQAITHTFDQLVTDSITFRVSQDSAVDGDPLHVPEPSVSTRAEVVPDLLKVVFPGSTDTIVDDDPPPSDAVWSSVTIREGDTLAGIFHRRGLRPADAI